MSKLNEKFVLNALAVALLTLYGSMALAAQDDDKDDDKGDEEEVDIVPLVTPDSFVSLGVGRWSGERAQLGMYDGRMEDDTGILVDADIRLRDAATGTWKTATLRNLGLDNREVSLGYERQGNWGVSVDYNQIPRTSPYTIHTGLEGIGTATQTLVDIAADPALGRDVSLETQRDRLGLSFFKNLRPGLDFRVSFRNEKKEGSRLWGGYFDSTGGTGGTGGPPGGGGGGGAPGFLAEPIDSTTRLLDATLNYSRDRLQLSGGYSGSWYDNSNQFLDVLDLLTGTHSYFALPPDNEAHQAFITGAYAFTPNTRGTLKAAYTRQTQDDPFPALPDAVAYPTLDAEVNTTLFNVGLTSRPIDKLSLLANFRYQDRDDETPVVAIENATYRPQSYTTVAGKAEGTVLLPRGFALTGGVDFNDIERALTFLSTTGPATPMAYREENKERTYRVQLRRSLSETLNGAVSLARSDRDGSDWIASGGTVLVNPIHMADRERRKVRLMLDWMPSERLGVQLNVEGADDEYAPAAGQPYGLQDGSARLYSLDASYSITPNWQLTAWYSRDKTEANQFYQTETGDAVTYRLSDIGDSVGLGVRGKVGEKLSLGADLQWTRNVSKYPVETAYISSDVDSNLPDIENELTRFKFFAQYALRKNGDLRFDYTFERWNTDDWTWLMADGSAYAYPADGTTVILDPKQTGHIFALRYIYRFQ